MNEKPLVSVIIPTYKRPMYLKRCIQSVLNQSYPNIEIIVVDDNNPDTAERKETEELMEEFSGYPSIQYLQHECNKNGSAARNTGWRNASGKYITYLDDDDEIEKEKIEKQVACLAGLDDSWGACYTGYRLIKEHGANQISSEKRSGNCYIDALMRTMFMGSGSNLLLRKSVVDEIGGYNESFQRNQDIEFLVRVLEHYKLAYVDETLLTIYQEGNRANKSFEEIDSYSQHYLNTFREKIDALAPNDKQRVIAVISLERCRTAFYKKQYKAGISILKNNHVSVVYIIKYFEYLMRRAITKQSYGFTGK